MSRVPINVVWFKRDLRLSDHLPLFTCIEQSLPTVLLYCFEPDLMQSPDADTRHWRFIWQSLSDMQAALPTNVSLEVVHANAIDVFEYLHQQFQVKAVFSHEETGNRLSYDRDISMASFFSSHGIQWNEFQTNGIIRRLLKRSDWNRLWHQTMCESIKPIELNKLVTVNIGWPKAWHVNTLPIAIKRVDTSFQLGGETKAHQLLNSFVGSRSASYMKHISKPLESRNSCSRLSPFLAYGNISIRQVFQATIAAIENGLNKKQLRVFAMRLHWHCHFIQKFESECRMEFENLNRAFNNIRNDVNEQFYQAWAQGKTGYPLIDACMQCLKQTGYINFRMRAMLVSFLTHNLWQHWKVGAHHLARYFLDYEPGIHYAQFQMQAGTMGVNTIRTYNPVKQSQDHDVEGVFIKNWVPSLRQVPVAFIHEPWLMPIELQQQFNCMLGVDYPLPIVPLSESSKQANAILWEVKKSAEAKHQNVAILKKHTGRKSEQELAVFRKKANAPRKKDIDLNYKLF